MLTDYFEKLSAQEILQETPAKWNDYDLLDLLQLFENLHDIERETAVLELILSSPDNNREMVNYEELYDNLIYSYINQENYSKAAYWAFAALVYEVRYDNSLINRRSLKRTLIEIYLGQEDYDAALQLTIRLLQADPTDYWTYNTLALALPSAELTNLAVAALERALELAKEDNDPDEITSQFQSLYDELKETAVSPPPDIHPDSLAQFHHALTLPPLPEETEPGRYLPPVADLFNQGETLDDALQQTIIAQGKVLAPELIEVAFDEDYWGTAVNRHAISLLRQIDETEPALDALTPWLEQAADEKWPQLLCERTGKIGGLTTPALKTLIANTNLGTLIRADAARDLLARLESSPEQRSDIIEFCRTLLTRQEAYEAGEELFIAMFISAVTDTDATELYPEIKQVFDEDRLNPTITDLPFIHQKWGLTPLPSTNNREDGLYVDLKCNKCERIRRYFVQHVTIDVTTLESKTDNPNIPYDHYIMDRPIVCPKCGAVDQYKTDPLTSMRLLIGGDMENMLSQFKGNKSKPDPFVTRIRPQAFGKDMHPLAAIDKYKQIALNRLNDAEPHWRIGNILRMIRRDEQAREAYQRSLELDESEISIWYALAATEHDLGNIEEAQKLYEKVIKSISPVKMIRNSELMDISMSAAEGLKALEQGLPSLYAQEYRTPEEKPKPNRKERRAQKKQMRKKKRKKKTRNKKKRR